MIDFADNVVMDPKLFLAIVNGWEDALSEEREKCAMDTFQSLPDMPARFSDSISLPLVIVIFNVHVLIFS